MVDNVNTIENFFGVYLLYCKNPKYAGRTYIGYTVDPNRRIKQHNKGKKAGGAWKTSKRGPWSMVMIIHGFPSDIAALRFEWAWQHPHISRRLSHVAKKRSREKGYDYCLRVLAEMLRVGPWNRLPLTVRWLDDEFIRDFPIDAMPPIHMPIISGSVVSKKLPKSQTINTQIGTNTIETCYICGRCIEGRKLVCVDSTCDLVSHVICLSKVYSRPGEYIPIEGSCPKCHRNFLWGDIVRKYKGCYSTTPVVIQAGVCDGFYSSDSD